MAYLRWFVLVLLSAQGLSWFKSDFGWLPDYGVRIFWGFLRFLSDREQSKNTTTLRFSQHLLCVSENTTISHQVPCSLRYPPTGLVLTRSSSTMNRLLNIVNIRIILIDSPHLTTLGTPLFSKRTLHIVDNVLINYTSPSYVLPIFHRVSSYENTLCKMSFGNSL